MTFKRDFQTLVLIITGVGTVILALFATSSFFGRPLDRTALCQLLAVFLWTLLLLISLYAAVRATLLRQLKEIEAYALAAADGAFAVPPARKLFPEELGRLQLSIEKTVGRCHVLHLQTVSLELEILRYREARDGLSMKKRELEAQNAELERLVRQLACDLESAKARPNQTLAAEESPLPSNDPFLVDLSREIGARTKDLIGMLQSAMQEPAPPRQVMHLLEATVAATSIMGLVEQILNPSRTGAHEQREHARAEPKPASEESCAAAGGGDKIEREAVNGSCEELLRVLGRRGSFAGPRRSETVATAGEEHQRWRKGG